MGIYVVKKTLTGTISLEIEASSESDALRKARNINVEDSECDWESNCEIDEYPEDTEDEA